MTRPVLYSFRRCPFAMRARMALDVAGVDLEHREVLLRDKPHAMLSASPKGTVPVLVLPDGRVIDESLDVMLWALAQYDPEGWLVEAKSDASEVNSFLTSFKPKLDRYKYASRYSDDASRGSVDLEQRSLAISDLREFADPLEHAPYLRGPSARLIDIATFPFVRQFANVEPDWWREAAPTALQSWLAGLLRSERFLRIMEKHPVWVPDDR